MGNARGACRSRGLVGYPYLELGAYPEAERARARPPRAAHHRKANLGLTLAHLGRLDEALATARQAALECAASAAPRVRGRASRDGDVASAHAALLEARTRLRARAAWITRAPFLELPANKRTLDLAQAWLGAGVPGPGQGSYSTPMIGPR